MGLPHVAALGGGHGLYASLRALRPVTETLTAIVTVADDGGSSGRLREEFGVVPPGDLRMALSALCEDTDWGTTWRDVLQSRFASDGPLDGHAVGNLLITALWEHTGDVVGGLDWVARLLRAQGRVLPVCEEPVEITARVAGPDGERTVTGQVAVASAGGSIVDLSLQPTNPRVPAATLEAIATADVVVLGPGSWYTSVLTHFLVPDVRKALGVASPRAVLTLNISDEDIETRGMHRADEVLAVRALAPEFCPAIVLADAAEAADGRLGDAVADWGSTLLVAPLRAGGAIDRHDETLLAAQYARAFEWMTLSGTRQPR
ncbi:gluconeogenesis factor YvcK family protein [Demequina sp.]|uniref:gluconeogenesis factor YvcK family protein n=1 Tax=Demequina sp. TaxID=2050685 RepID=UPI003D112E7E